MPRTQSAQHVALGDALRELRTQRGISQEELAYRAGMHRNYVGACERGEINLSFRVLLQFTEGLAVNLSEIVAHYERIQQVGEHSIPSEQRPD
ncbi:MAG: helix-turn-helix domain-containing protein [Solirubrobacteraceae bacterium]